MDVSFLSEDHVQKLVPAKFFPADRQLVLILRMDDEERQRWLASDETLLQFRDALKIAQ